MRRPVHGCHGYRSSPNSVPWAFSSFVVQSLATTPLAGPSSSLRRGDASPAVRMSSDRRGTCARWVTPYLSRCCMTNFCALQAVDTPRPSTPTVGIARCAQTENGVAAAKPPPKTAINPAVSLDHLVGPRHAGLARSTLLSSPGLGAACETAQSERANLSPPRARDDEGKWVGCAMIIGVSQ